MIRRRYGSCLRRLLGVLALCGRRRRRFLRLLGRLLLADSLELCLRRSHTLEQRCQLVVMELALVRELGRLLAEVARVCCSSRLACSRSYSS
ncbi:MAG TPA: hypothetical protein VHS03_00875 [Gaiellaceae bacterium]|nr:hypothetical protein [Gaiellaceae bacterium]